MTDSVFSLAIQGILPCSMCLFVPADSRHQRRGEAKRPLADVHAPHHHHHAPRRLVLLPFHPDWQCCPHLDGSERHPLVGECHLFWGQLPSPKLILNPPPFIVCEMPTLHGPANNVRRLLWPLYDLLARHSTHFLRRHAMVLHPICSLAGVD